MERDAVIVKSKVTILRQEMELKGLAANNEVLSTVIAESGALVFGNG
jgi:hypothetical protein